MNRTDTMKMLSSRSDGAMPVVALAAGDDYVLGVTVRDVKRNYYTPIYTEWDPRWTAKVAEDMAKGTAVTLKEMFGGDAVEYVYETLTGYTICPWNMSLIARRFGEDLKGFEREREKYRWVPEGGELY